MERHASDDKEVLDGCRFRQRASSNLASRVEYMNTFKHLEKKRSKR